ncbi:MAG: MarR family winged helix-turn-helix transcriptional regulator [Chloroflexota bacterium]
MVQVRLGVLPPGAERKEYLESQPTYWLKRCYQLLRRNVDYQLRQYDLTLSQRDVLLNLWEAGPLDQGSLRQRLGLEQSSVSRLVDGLMRRGLVVVDHGDIDRRVRVASLTELGRETLSRTPGSSELGGRAMTSSLSPDELHDLIRLLRTCADNLSAERDESMKRSEQEM